MYKIKIVLLNNLIFFLSIAVYILLQYFFFFSNGKIVLGGEGNYWLNFSTYLQTYGYTWLDNTTTGYVATSLNAIFIYPLLLSFIKNIRILSFLIISSVYILPFTGMYILLKKLYKDNIQLVCFISLFFIANPFSLIYLVALNPWGVHILFSFPLFFLIFYKYYIDYAKLFTVFGMSSLILAYTLTNPPLMLLTVISLPFLLLLAHVIKSGYISMADYFKEILIIYTSFFLFNIWWLVHWLLVFSDAKEIFTVATAKEWLLQIKVNTPFIMKDIFSLNWLTPKSVDYSFFSYFYNLPIINLILFIPIFIVFYWVIFKSSKSEDRKIIFLLLAVLSVIILFINGPNPPFNRLLLVCFDYVPFCYLFKTVTEKFGVLFIFYFTLILFFILKNINNKWILRTFYLYVIVLLIPFFTGNYIPDYRLDIGKYGTRKLTYLPEFQKISEEINEKKLDFRLLSLPTGGNYQIMMKLEGNKYYTGMDPILNNTARQHLADYSGVKFYPLFTNIDDNNYDELLSYYTERYILLNKRNESWFGNITGLSLSRLENILSQKVALDSTYGELILYKSDKFLPHFYTPQSILLSSDKPDGFHKLVLNGKVKDRSAVFYQNQITNKRSQELLNSISSTYDFTPIIEFKKINPTKYRIVIHRAKKNFLLIFSESFHKFWKIYAIKPDKNIGIGIKNLKSSLDSYKILGGNNDDQATKEELSLFIQNDWISTLGKGHNIGFISKNFQDTIQNDNLSSGSISDTWFANEAKSILKINNNVYQLPDENHLMTNGYANAWIIDPESICQTQGPCNRINGSFDIELIAEFWPQRLFYIGVIISSIVCLLSLIYLTLRKYNGILRDRV